jgi:pilus assembly protein CpaB
MKLARIAVLCFALIAAIAAAWIAKGMLGSNKQVAQALPKFETVKVLTAAGDLTLGKIIQAGSLRWRDWPKSAVTSSLVTNRNFPNAMKKFNGARVRAPFVSGEPILRTKLVLNGKGGVLSAILPAGMRAISTRISPETGAGGFILPNDRVDVILTRKDSRGRKDNTFARTILTNVRVLAIDQTIEEKKGKDKVVVGKTATLELTPPQAEILAMSEKVGSLSLALRSLADAAGKEQKGPQLAGGRNGRRGSVAVLRYGASSMERPRF